MSPLLLLFVIVTFARASDFNIIGDVAELTDPSWKDLIGAGGIHIGHGRTKRFVTLDQNQPNIPYQACLLPNGKAGHCRHLQHCIQEEFKTDFSMFMDYLCVINRSAIGVCCQDGQETQELGLAGNLPAIASGEEKNEAVIKVKRAENRGCGLSTRSQGILSGARPANPREWPWMALVTPEYCGGVLITDQHVLTAAHCVKRWLASELMVRLGEYDFTRNDDSRSFDFRVVEKRQHEDFQHDTYMNDVAILKLHRAAMLNSYVWPICLPPYGMDLVNKTAVVIGWGTQWYGGPKSDVLMEVSVPVWEHQRCVDSYIEKVFDENICAGGYEGGKDACQGDSGGPLMYQMESGRWVTIGVVSWGVHCGEPHHPGVYASVDKYLGWIIQNSRF